MEARAEHSRKDATQRGFWCLLVIWIGIDLGTTNSVVAYIDTEKVALMRTPLFLCSLSRSWLPQGRFRTLPALPSFLYFPTEDERLPLE